MMFVVFGCDLRINVISETLDIEQSRAIISPHCTRHSPIYTESGPPSEIGHMIH